MSVSLTGRVTGKTMSVISFIALLIFLPLLLLAAYQTATIISRAAGISASIVVDAGSISQDKVDPTFMRAFAQGGEEPGNWLFPIQKEVAALKPKWIRIDHIFDFYDIVKKDGESLSFDFSKLDPLIDTILATGATPVISLSYMPPAIAKEGKVINPPDNWDDWALVVQKTIEHISGTAGKNIAGVYYEVWNEPDQEQFGGWKLSGDKNYLTLYRYAANGARLAKQTQKFFFGGPATTGLYKDWIIAIATSGERLDFISWHTYLDDPKRYALDQQNISSWLLPYPEVVLTPKLITEFGFTGAKDARYGTSFATAFTAAVFRELASGNPKALFSFELKGNWGLIDTPRYYIYDFLYRLSGNRLLLSGEGTWVTGLSTKLGERVRVMLVNFDATGNHSETVPVTIKNLPNGNYTYRQQYLQGLHPDEAKTAEESITDGTLVKQLFMPAQSVIFIELYPVPRH